MFVGGILPILAIWMTLIRTPPPLAKLENHTDRSAFLFQNISSLPLPAELSIKALDSFKSASGYELGAFVPQLTSLLLYGRTSAAMSRLTPAHARDIELLEGIIVDKCKYNFMFGFRMFSAIKVRCCASCTALANMWLFMTTTIMLPWQLFTGEWKGQQCCFQDDVADGATA